MKTSAQPFGVHDNREVTLYTIKNNQGVTLECINYGCIITDIRTPDKNGVIESIVLGFDSLEEYLHFSPYFGAMIGRVAGRIRGGEFELDGISYVLGKNENGNHLHGGEKSFSHIVWDARMVERENEAGVEFTCFSPDGEGGYPGNLEMTVSYLLNNDNELTILVNGIPDQKTLLNVTNHTYFNLSGNLKRDILNHRLLLKSGRYLELMDNLIPSGKIVSVDNTPFDFREGRKLQDGTESSHPQTIIAGYGYDHPFLLDEASQPVIQLSDEESGRRLTIETDQPAVVVYSGNQLEDHFRIRGVQSGKYLGICLETQGLPDAIHHPHFPSVITEKNEVYRFLTKYTFNGK